MISSEVVIIGGGPGGLSAALALARSGVEVTVLEAGQSTPRDRWGFVIWPSGTRALQWLGVLHQVRAAGRTLEAYRWYAADGREWTSVDLRKLRDAGEWLGVLPSKLHAILQGEAERAGVRLVRGVEGIAVERDGGGLLKARGVRQGQEVEATARLVIGADGPDSRLRRLIGARSWRWRPFGQVVVTGIGGGLGFSELRQAVGDGWSGGCVTLGGEDSWVFATVRQRSRERGLTSLRAYGALDRQAEGAVARMSDAAELRPWSVRVMNWAADGVMLIGDAAHAMLPHLGLGGSMTLEGVPVLSEVVERALRTGDTSAASLKEFQRRRRSRVAYARRVSEMWALSMTSRLPGMRQMRDLNFWRMSRHPEMMEAFLREMGSGENPRLGTRLRVWLP